MVTTQHLLERCGTPKGRKELAEITGINSKKLLTWVKHADLMRIKGIGPQYSELLEAAGVDTVKELKGRKAANLASKMKELNGQNRVARVVPAETTVIRWIESAKTLSPAVSY